MGNEPPKKGKRPTLTKQSLEMVLLKIKNHCEVLKQRKANDISIKENALRKLIDSPNRSKSDELAKASALVQDTNYFRSLDITIRNALILKEHSLFIVENLGYPERMNSYLPTIENLLFVEAPLNIQALKEFETTIHYYMGTGVYNDVNQSPNVDPELKKCTQVTMPTPMDIDKYLVEFCQRNSIDLSRLTMIGHNINIDAPGQNQNPYGGGGGLPIPNQYQQGYGSYQQGPSYGGNSNQYGNQPGVNSMNFQPGYQQPPQNFIPPQNFTPNYSNYIPPNMPQSQQFGLQPLNFQPANFQANPNPNPVVNQPSPHNYQPPPQNFQPTPNPIQPNSQPNQNYPSLDSTYNPKNNSGNPGYPNNGNPGPTNFGGGPGMGGNNSGGGGSKGLAGNLEDRLKNLENL